MFLLKWKKASEKENEPLFRDILAQDKCWHFPIAEEKSLESFNFQGKMLLKCVRVLKNNQEICNF